MVQVSVLLLFHYQPVTPECLFDELSAGRKHIFISYTSQEIAEEIWAGNDNSNSVIAS